MTKLRQAMMIDQYIQMLMPDNDDSHTDEIRSFFKTIIQLISADFMGITIDHKHPLIIDAQQLKSIYNSYKGKLTKPDYVTRVFIASTYQLPTLQADYPSPEWQWIAKLCHLLLYFAQHDLVRRIEETSIEARKWINPAHANHSLWQLCHQKLQSTTLEDTYRNFNQYLQALEVKNDPNLKDFVKIYRTLDFAFNERQRITRASTGRRNNRNQRSNEAKTEYIVASDVDDDADELVSVVGFEEVSREVDIYRERLDNPVPNFTYLKQSTLQATERYSASLIYRRTQAKFTHANKNERFISCNIRQLPLTALQNITALLWQWFDHESIDRDKKRAIAYLLLCLYTGRSVNHLAEDIDTGSKQLIDISPRKKTYSLIIKLNITPLRIRTQGIEEVIANRLTNFMLPLPPTLGIFLTYKGAPKIDLINKIINSLRDELKLPLLSLARIEKSLYSTLIRDVSTSQIASIITGRNDKKRADLWYCSHTIQSIKNTYQQAIKLLTARCIDRKNTVDYLSEVSLTNVAIGSQNSPDYPIISVFIDHLRKQVETLTDYIDKFNAYNLWLWHVSLLLTSIRAVEGAPGMLNQLNLITGLAWISDKEERVRSGSQRLVPICSFLSTAINNFLKYLESFAKRYGRLNVQINVMIEAILNSSCSLLNYLNSDGTFESLRPAIVNKTLEENFRFKVDWTRHVGQRFLHEQGIDEAIIMAVFGHEMMGQETWRKHSSLSIGHILGLQETYDALADKLKLKQVEL